MMTSHFLKTALVAFALSSVCDRRNAVAVEVLAGGDLSPSTVRSHDYPLYPPTSLPNADIAEEVRAAFARDLLLADNKISVTDGVGMVTLDGTVDSPFEKQHAEDLAASIRGVVTIVNGLEVGRPLAGAPMARSERFMDSVRRQFGAMDSKPDRSANTDRELKRQVEQELRWNPFVEAEKVQVHVKRGVVTLTGVTDSEHGYRAATAMAREAGAMRVRNLMKIE